MKILVLGTGAAQNDLIKACKEKGMAVFACSSRTGDPGEYSADYFEQIDIVNKQAVFDYSLKNEIDLIYSAGSDVAMPTVFTVAEQLGLRAFCKANTAIICNTKSLLREALGQNFKGNIPFQSVTSAEEPIQIPYPFMMKPIDSQGQRGVFRVQNHEEYRSHFEESLVHSRAKRLILETYIEGEEISVNTFCIDGKMIFFQPSDRIVWEGHTGGLIRKHIMPGKWATDPESSQRIRDLVERTLKKLEIENGPAYFQIMMDKQGEPYLIEVTPRLDGCHMWRLIRYATGVDLLGLTISALEGEKVEVPNYSVKPYVTEFFCQAPGTVFSKDLYHPSSCEYLEWYYNDGETVRKMNGFKEKCGYCIFSND